LDGTRDNRSLLGILSISYYLHSFIFNLESKIGNSIMDGSDLKDNLGVEAGVEVDLHAARR